MIEVETLRSFPGEWIGRDGRPRPRTTVQRIAVIKADHIGDLLIALPAFTLLRYYFPDAQIELICGKWNVDLARGFGCFDEVHGVNLFHEVSGLQADQFVALETRRLGAEAMRELSLGYFDLAIDLRYDADTRPLLRNIDSGIYAGFGSAPEFPFLDILLCHHEGRDLPGVDQTSIVGDGFSPRGGNGSSPLGLKGGNGHLSSRRSSIIVSFSIRGAATPRSCGAGADDRLLGVGLERLYLTPLGGDGAALGSGSLISPNFGSGWDNPEVWGCWTIGELAHLEIAVPYSANAEFYRIEMTVRAHVNRVNRSLTCLVQVDGSDGELEVEFSFPMEAEIIELVVPSRLERRELTSGPFDLSPGRYDGLLRLFAARPLPGVANLEIVLRAGDGNVELLRRGLHLDKGSRGLIGMPFSMIVDTSARGLTFEIETNDTIQLDGVRVHQVSFTKSDKLKTTIPVAHMEEWASLLILRVAQVLSNVAPFGLQAPHRHNSESTSPIGQQRPESLLKILRLFDEWKAQGYGVVGVALGCNSEIRRWPLPYFLDLVDRIISMGRTRVVFIGGPNDKDEADEVCMQLGIDSSLHSLCGATRLNWLGPLLEGLDLFIGSNTGTTHFAGRVGTRAIGIYAGTNHPREWGPVGPEASWIFRNEPCSPCHLTRLSDCTKAHRCMIDLLPEDVFRVVHPELEAILCMRNKAISADC